MPLDNLQLNNQQTELIKDVLEGTRDDSKQLEGEITNISASKLQSAIATNLKVDGKRKSYTEMIKTPGYAFFVQSSITMLSNALDQTGTKLDKNGNPSKQGESLSEYLGKIDMQIGPNTKNTIKIIQKYLGYRGEDVDGKAGPKFFEDITTLLKTMDNINEDIKTTINELQKHHEGRLSLPEDVTSIFSTTANFKLGGHILPEDIQNPINNKVYTTLETDLIQNLKNWNEQNIKEQTVNNYNKDLYFSIGVGTDATPVKNEKLTESDYIKKKTEIISILGKSKIQNFQEILNLINSDIATKQHGYTNNRLLGMRYLEGIKASLTAYNVLTQGVKTDIKLHFYFDKRNSKPGNHRNTEDERAITTTVYAQTTKEEGKSQS